MSDQPPYHSICFARPFPLQFNGGEWDGLKLHRRRAPKWIQLVQHGGEELALDPVQTMPLFEPPTAAARAAFPTYERRLTPEGPIQYDHLPNDT